MNTYKRKYQTGGKKEASINYPLYDLNGRCYAGCTQRNYEPHHNLSVGTEYTAGLSDNNTFTGSGKLWGGYTLNPAISGKRQEGVKGYIGANIGGRVNVPANIKSNELQNTDNIKFGRFANAVGTLGYEGEVEASDSFITYKRGRRGNPMKWGAGAYVNKDLMGDNGWTLGGYGHVGKVGVSGGYNKKTGPEFKATLGIPIRKTGGLRKYQNAGVKNTDNVSAVPTDPENYILNAGMLPEVNIQEKDPRSWLKRNYQKYIAPVGHGILDVAGMIPAVGEVADGINAAWYAAEGDKTNAALSTAAMIPFVGWGATLGKWGAKGGKTLAKKAAKESTEQVVKAADVPQTWSKGVTHYGKVGPEGTDLALTGMKDQGKYLDNIGFDVSTLNGKNIVNHGNMHGRQIVEVALPDGKTQLFYKSTDLAGKGTEGLWQPFGGHANTIINGNQVDNWFIKDAGYKNYYGSKSFKGISDNLDRIAAEEGWDMSGQILKSQMKQTGGIKNNFVSNYSKTLKRFN